MSGERDRLVVVIPLLPPITVERMVEAIALALDQASDMAHIDLTTVRLNVTDEQASPVPGIVTLNLSVEGEPR